MSLEQIRHRLETDYPYYAERCLKIIHRTKKLKLVGKPAQMRIEAALEAQRAAGKPQRVIIPKARREGVSTWIEGKLVHHTTTRAHRKALVVAHNKKTAAELHEMAVIMYANLPNETIAGLQLKPPIAAQEKGSELKFGERSRVRRAAGELGLNSSLLVDTAGEVETGRGFEYHDLHLSEIAFWDDIVGKLRSIFQTVEDDPDTLIAIESTANGRNHFYKMCKDAERGDSDYTLVFLAWFEEPNYRRPFIREDDRAELVDSIGTGEWGDGEGELIELMGSAPYSMGYEEILERLNWRRWAIMNRCAGDLRTFHQEYPSTLEEAFLATSGQVFSQAMVARARTRAAELPAPTDGLYRIDESLEVKRRGQTITVPKSAIWVPRSDHDTERDGIVRAWWNVWEQPDPGVPEEAATPDKPARPPGRYVVVTDPSSGEQLADPGQAYSAIQVLNHRTREQAAEYRSREDPDVIALKAMLAALHYNGAWLTPEVTGGYGDSMALKIWKDWRYPFVYFRPKSPTDRTDKKSDRLGWQTTLKTLPMLIDWGKELLRTEQHGIRSFALLDQFGYYVRDDKGKTGPEEGETVDLLLAWLIAQFLCHEIPVRSERRGTVPIGTHASLQR